MTNQTALAARRTTADAIGDSERFGVITGADVVQIEYDALGSVELRLADVLDSPAGHWGRIRRLVFATVWGVDSTFDAPSDLEIVCEVDAVSESPLLERYRKWCADTGVVERAPRQHFRVTFDRGTLDVLATGWTVILETELWGP